MSTALRQKQGTQSGDGRRAALVVHVDNDLELVLQIKELLQGRGLAGEVTQVVDWQDLARVLQEPRLGLILCDQVLPACTARELLELARNRRPEVPFIVLAGQLSDAVQEELKCAGAEACVGKENLERLVPTVRRALLKSREKARCFRARSKLVVQEGFYRKLLEAAQDVLLVLDGERRFSFVSASVQAVLGWWPERLVGASFLEYVHPEERPLFLSVLEPVLEDASAQAGCEVRLQGGDGQWHFVEIQVQNHRQTVEIGGVVLTIRDIGRRKRVEARLCESEAHLSAAQTAGGMGSLTFELVRQEDWRVVGGQWSEEAFRLLGLDAGKAEPGLEALLNALREEERPKLRAALFKTLRTEKPERVACRVGLAKGKVRFLECELMLSRRAEEEARSCQVMILLRDVTAERELYEALQRSNEHLREQAALLDQAQDAILVCALDTRLLYWNKGAERLHGWSSHEAVGRCARDFLYSDTTWLDRALHTLLQTGEWSGEVAKRTRGGGELFTQTRWTLVRDAQGLPKAIFCISTDVTNQHKLQAQLFRAQRIESIGRLASGVAHDLNNILTPILVSTAVLRQRSADAECRRVLDMLEGGVKRGAEIVRQILWFSRGLEGQRVLLNPRMVLKDVASFIQETFDKGIRIETAIEPGGWSLLADPTQVHQVLLNLCVNSRDAMPHGGVLSIHVSNREVTGAESAASAGLQPGRYVVMAVKDTGAGIEKEVLEHIFEPFFTTKDVQHGTGLGLSTVQAIVQNYGGFIEVESAPGKGTTFRVNWPAHAAHTPEEANTAQRRVFHGRGQLVLLADDEAALRSVGQTVLESYGYRVLSASNGVEALELCKTHRKEIRAVIMDLMMPVLDGGKAVAALRQAQLAVPVIVATGLGEEHWRTELEKLGVGRFLPKPYSAEQLLTQLQELFEPGSAPSA